MADEGHVLAKYHIAESILTTERWNLHADGTTRDHKKIVGQQVTLGDRRALSAGFTSVSVEGSATLLDVAISLLTDLADLYSEEDTKIR